MARRVDTPQTGADAAIASAAAIATHFEGDAVLYEAFAAACATQFPHDVTRGNAACASGDLARLARLAHDLKAALAVLGHARASELAAHAEARAAARDPAAARLAWEALKEVLPNTD